MTTSPTPPTGPGDLRTGAARLSGIAGAAGLVVFGVVAAGVVGQLPAFGVTDGAVVASACVSAAA